MNDTFREMEQQGARVTQLEDGVKVDWGDGWAWTHFDCGVTHGEGPPIVLPERPKPRPWWRRLLGT